MEGRVKRFVQEIKMILFSFSHAACGFAGSKYSDPQCTTLYFGLSFGVTAFLGILTIVIISLNAQHRWKEKRRVGNAS